MDIWQNRNKSLFLRLSAANGRGNNDSNGLPALKVIGLKLVIKTHFSVNLTYGNGFSSVESWQLSQ
jgi:hypothetical protein